MPQFCDRSVACSELIGGEAARHVRAHTFFLHESYSIKNKGKNGIEVADFFTRKVKQCKRRESFCYVNIVNKTKRNHPFGHCSPLSELSILVGDDKINDLNLNVYERTRKATQIWESSLPVTFTLLGRKHANDPLKSFFSTTTQEVHDIREGIRSTLTF